jgi:1-deoxy-D-xylulose-5-phosphate reductoisomerase
MTGLREKEPAGITILGSTGSIGLSTLDVVSQHPDRFRVVALTANSDVDTLAAQCRQFHPRYAVMADPAAAEQLEQRLGDVLPEVNVLAGTDALVEMAGLPEVDYVMAAIVGAAGLLPSLEAARKGKHVLLANKEALVMSGALFMQAVHDNNAVLLPIDSEHNALLQCMPDGYTAGTVPPGVRSITLTASGGPFREMPVSKLASVTPEQACEHPNWNMGRKISVDSATMMNKGLEVIEAGWLFNLPVENIRVILHPQSILHSMVEYTDGSVLAQLGNPDMRIPISYALGWPDRIFSGAKPLDIAVIGQLQFCEPDLERFPCLALAFGAWRAGGTAPAVLNAANEMAVQAFLDRQLAFTDIPRTIDYVMDHCDIQDAGSLDAVLAADARARVWAMEYIKSVTGRVVGT